MRSFCKARRAQRSKRLLRPVAYSCSLSRSWNVLIKFDYNAERDMQGALTIVLQLNFAYNMPKQ
jgi:hypothetical protein